MIWNISQNRPKFMLVTKEYPSTKLWILLLAFSVFNHLVILKARLLDLKLIIEELWKLEFDWGSVSLHEIKTIWIKLKVEINKTLQISLNCWYGFRHVDKMEVRLNIFLVNYFLSFCNSIVSGRKLCISSK